MKAVANAFSVMKSVVITQTATIPNRRPFVAIQDYSQNLQICYSKKLLNYKIKIKLKRLIIRTVAN